MAKESKTSPGPAQGVRDMSVVNFEEECIKTARTLSRESDVKVRFSAGGEASAKGDTINLPALDRNARIDQSTVNIARGYVDHESKHIESSEDKVLDRMEKDYGDWVAKMTNALEDVRLDGDRIKEHPGSKVNLGSLAEFCAAEVLERYPTSESEHREEIWDNAKNVLPILASWSGHQQMGLDAPSLDDCIEATPEKLRNGVAPFAKAALGAKSSRECANIAVALGKAMGLIDPKEEEPYPEEGSGGVGGKPGEGSDGTDEGEGPNEHDGYEVKSGSVTEEGEAGSGGGIGAGEERVATSAEEMLKRVQEGIKDILEDVSPKDSPTLNPDFNISSAFERPKSGAYLNIMRELDAWHCRGKSKDTNTRRMQEAAFGGDYKYDNILQQTEDGKRAYTRLRSQMQGVISVCARKLQRALIARANTDWQPRKTSGRLNTRSLARTVSELDPYAYKRKGESNAVNAAISIVIDQSGSMGGEKISLAQKAVVAIAESLESIEGVEYEIIGFSCDRAPSDWDRYDKLQSRAQALSRKGYNVRQEPIDMYEFKSFDDRLNDAHSAIAAIRHAGMGNNCDGESIEMVYERLRKRKEPRKVMIVLSDGHPACMLAGAGRHGLDDHLKSVIENIEKSNVSIAGIGILDSSVTRFYTNNIVIDDVEDIGTTMFDKLARALLGERFEVNNSKLGRAA